MRIVERGGLRLRIFRGEGGWALLYPLKLVLSWGYGLLLAVRARRNRPTRATHQSRERGDSAAGPLVISIGNLEVGGGGKTPCAISLAETIRDGGGRPVVLSRGYGSIASRRWAPFAVPPARGATDETPVSRTMTYGAFRELVSSSAAGGERRALASFVGDEIVLYRERGIPVVIDPDRVRGAAWARELFSPTHLLLDDAYHVSTIEKDVDILLLDAQRPLGNGRLLPLGTLRERPEAAARADVVIFTRAEARLVPPAAARLVGGKPVFFGRHEPVDLMTRAGTALPLSFLKGRGVVLFSGIARPASFEEMAASLGALVDLAFRYIDHHRYGGGDVARMLREGGEGAVFVTTEKDWVKAADLFPAANDVLALRVRMRIDAPRGRVESLLHLPYTDID
jgi:tetraacyldisaccharide 4'-kinase